MAYDTDRPSAAAARERAVLLPEGEYARYLAIQAASQADEQVRKREARWHTLLVAMFTVFAILGYTNIDGIRNDLKGELKSFKEQLDAVPKTIEREVQREVRTQLPRETAEYLRSHGKEIVSEPITGLRDELDSHISYLEFVMRAYKMEEAASFSNEDRDLAISLLERAARSKKISESSEFAAHLEKLLDALSDVRSIGPINSIEAKFRDTIRKRKGIVYTMADHYGLVVLGEAEVSAEALDRFRFYMQAARDSGWRNLSAIFNPAFSFKQAGYVRNPITDEFVKELNDLPQESKEDALRRIDDFATGKRFKRQTAYSQRISNVFRSISTTYKAELDEIRKTAR